MWKKSLLIISLFIALRQKFYESYCLLFLELIGFFLFQLEIPFLVDVGLIWARSVERCGRQPPLCLFWEIWKEINRIAFENEELSIHRLKNYFVCNLWLWTKSVVNEGPLPLFNFFDWLGSR